ncbi:hypothetical protein STEG23_022752 [Scotinomys teguina]
MRKTRCSSYRWKAADWRPLSCSKATTALLEEESELFGEAVVSLEKDMTTLEHFTVPDNKSMLKIGWSVSKEHWAERKGVPMAKATI